MTTPDEHAVSAPPSSSLAESKILLARSRFLGRVSAVIFCFAVLAVADALQTLVRHEFNSIDLVAGESTLVSGMLPAGVSSHEGLVISYEGDGCATLSPTETYKGFWMGGQMWRAELAASDDCPPGRVTITVKDIIKPKSDTSDTKQGFDERDRSILYGGQQNPALVFAVTIWPTESALRAADTSLFRRYTRLPAFGVAVGCVVLAILAGLGNWRYFSAAESGLAANDVFFIHGVKRLQPEQVKGKNGLVTKGTHGYKASVARAGQSFSRGEVVVLLNRDWTEQAYGRIMEVDRYKAHALFPIDGVRPQYGWLLAKDSQTHEEAHG